MLEFVASGMERERSKTKSRKKSKRIIQRRKMIVGWSTLTRKDSASLRKIKLKLWNA